MAMYRSRRLGRHVIGAALPAAEFRGTTLEPLSAALDELAKLRATTYTTYRARLSTAGNHLLQSWTPRRERSGHRN